MSFPGTSGYANWQVIVKGILEDMVYCLCTYTLKQLQSLCCELGLQIALHLSMAKIFLLEMASLNSLDSDKITHIYPHVSIFSNDF